MSELKLPAFKTPLGDQPFTTLLDRHERLSEKARDYEAKADEVEEAIKLSLARYLDVNFGVRVGDDVRAEGLSDTGVELNPYSPMTVRYLSLAHKHRDGDREGTDLVPTITLVSTGDGSSRTVRLADLTGLEVCSQNAPRL